MQSEKIAKQRKTVEIYRGVRKIKAEADLVRMLVDDSNAEALSIAEQSIERARGLLERAKAANKSTAQYEDALAWILRAKAHALRNNSLIHEALPLMDEAMDLFRKVDNGRELFHSHLFKHVLFRDRRKLPAAKDELEFALELGRHLGMDWHEAEILGDLGTINHFLEDYATAREQFERSLELLQAFEKRNWHSEVTVNYHLAYLLDCTGEIHKSLDYYQVAVELGKEHKSEAMLLTLLHLTWMQAGAYVSLGDNARALKILEEWAVAARQATLDYPEASHRELAGKIQLNCGRYVAAYRSIARALTLYERVGSEGGIAMCRIATGAIYSACGESEIADCYFASGSAFFDELYSRHKGEDMSMLCVALITQVRYGSLHIDVDRYLDLLSGLIGKYSVQGDKRKDILLRLCVGVLHKLKGNTGAAREVLQAALALSKRLRYVDFQCDCHFFMAEFLKKAESAEAAIPHYEAALHLAQSSGRKETERMCRFCLVELLQKRDSAQAQQHMEHARALTEELMTPQVVMELRMLHYKAESERQRTVNEQLQAGEKEAQNSSAAMQRLLDAKIAEATHLKDALQKIGGALRQEQKKLDDTGRQRIRALIGEIENIVSDDSWQEFAEEIREQDEEFMQRLARDFPALTTAERRVCSLVRINTTTTKDIARLLNISPRTVQIYRYRIRKKMNLAPEADLLAYIQGM